MCIAYNLVINTQNMFSLIVIVSWQKQINAHLRKSLQSCINIQIQVVFNTLKNLYSCFN